MNEVRWIEQEWKDMEEQIEKTNYEETAYRLTQAAHGKCQVFYSLKQGGYVLVIGDVGLYDGLFIGTFDMSYESLESNVIQYSAQYAQYSEQ